MAKDTFLDDYQRALSGGPAMGWGGVGGEAARKNGEFWNRSSSPSPTQTDTTSDYPVSYYRQPDAVPELPPYWPFSSQEAYDAHQEEVRKAGGHDRYCFPTFGPWKQGKLVAKWNVTPTYDAADNWYLERRLTIRLALKLACSLIVFFGAMVLGLSPIAGGVGAVAGWYWWEITTRCLYAAAWTTVAVSYATLRATWLTIKWFAIVSFWVIIAGAVLATIYGVWVTMIAPTQ